MALASADETVEFLSRVTGSASGSRRRSVTGFAVARQTGAVQPQGGTPAGDPPRPRGCRSRKPRRGWSDSSPAECRLPYERQPPLSQTLQVDEIVAVHRRSWQAGPTRCQSHQMRRIDVCGVAILKAEEEDLIAHRQIVLTGNGRRRRSLRRRENDVPGCRRVVAQSALLIRWSSTTMGEING